MRRITLLTAWLAVAASVLAAPLGAGGAKPEKIALPDGFRPEGIAISRGGTFYVGSIPTGAIYRGSLRTGEGEIINAGATGRASIGVELHDGKLFVAGGSTGSGFVYSAQQRAAPEDVSLHHRDDDVRERRGRRTRWCVFHGLSPPVSLPRPDRRQRRRDTATEARATDTDRREATAIPLTGAIVYGEGNNANGIDTTHDGRTLIIVQTNVGKLFTVNRRTGKTREIVLDEPVVNGDGILLDGRTLYVVQNRDNKVAVIRLSRRLDSGDVRTHLTDPDFDVPTTIDDFGDRLYAVNARFRPTPPPPDFEYWINQFPKVES